MLSTEQDDSSDDGLLDELLEESERVDGEELRVQDVLKTLKQVEKRFEHDLKHLNARYSEEMQRLRASLLGVSIKADESRKRARDEEHSIPAVFAKKAPKKAKKQPQVSTFSHNISVIGKSTRVPNGLPRNHSEPDVVTQSLALQSSGAHTSKLATQKHAGESLLSKMQAIDGTVNHGHLLRAAKVEAEETTGDFLHVESGIRLREAHPDTSHLNHCTFLRLHKLLAEKIHDGEISVEKWWTAGVCVTRAEPRTTKHGSHYLALVLGDLKGNMVNLLLFDQAYEQFWKQVSVAHVLAVVMPKIPPSMDSHNSRMSLAISAPSQLVILGRSADFSMCRAMNNDGKQCTNVLDKYVPHLRMLTFNRREGGYCSYHSIETVRRGKLHRQELASSSAPLYVTGSGMTAHDIVKQRKSLKKEPSRNLLSGSVLVDGEMVAMGVQRVKEKRVEAEDPKRKEEARARLLEHLASDMSLGARQLRAGLGVADPKANSKAMMEAKQRVFGDALKDMGFDPLGGFGDVKARSPSKSPGKHKQDVEDELFIDGLDG